MWQARSKNDLIIEVWEKLDCENIGATEIEAIEMVIAEQFGQAAVESPMVIARLLADEGADLRHSEIMNLFVERASDRPYDAAFRNILNIADLKSTARSLAKLENLRQKYKIDGDKEGLRLVRSTALSGKQNAIDTLENEKTSAKDRQINKEIAQWFRIWLENPDVFAAWVGLRQKSTEFIEIFGEVDENK